MEDGRLLRVLTEAIQAKHVVEMGTSTGHYGLGALSRQDAEKIATVQDAIDYVKNLK